MENRTQNTHKQCRTSVFTFSKTAESMGNLNEMK